MTRPTTASCARPAVAALTDADLVTATMVRLAADAEGATVWSGDERRAMLERLDRAVDGLAAIRAAVLVAEREAGTWQGDGDPTFEAWWGRTSRAGQRSAAAQTRQAAQLDAVPAAAAAVAEGRISLDHAATIAKVASTGTPAQRDAALDAAGQDHLLGLAERLDAGTFATTVSRWAATIDPVALERDHEAQRRERYLSVVSTPGGTRIKGQLDSMAGHRLTLALEALSPRPAADDDRDPGQRRADALDAMAGRILALDDTKPGGHVPPQVTMILTEETFLGARAELERRRTSGGSDAGAGGDAGAEGAGAAHAPATLEDGTPVPLSELAAAMCDCEITRVVVDAAGAPLDLGRSARLFSGPQRRAVIARDRGCAWAGCPAHARWCEIHHIRFWERDAGPTSVENGVLLCSYHHHEVHRRDLTIRRVSGPGHAPPRRRSVGAGAPPGGPPGGGALPRAEYEFRDRAGRVVGGLRVDGGRAGDVRAVDARAVDVRTADARASRVPRQRPGPERGAGADAGPAAVPGAARADEAASTATAYAEATAPKLGAEAGATAVAAPRPGTPDGFEVEWATDPVTGARVLAWFVDG